MDSMDQTGLASRSPRNPTISLDLGGRDSPLLFAPNNESEEWIKDWQNAKAKDLIDVPLVNISFEATVEDACELLVAKNVPCITISNGQPLPPRGKDAISGLFDFADVNAFLVIAATQHSMSEAELQELPRVGAIVEAAKGGRVPVGLVSNISEKNPLEILEDSATVVDLLSVFGSGTHRVLIRSPASESTRNTSSFAGFVSDRSLLSFFYSHAQSSPAPGLSLFLSNPLHSLSLPALSLRSEVSSCSANDTVLDAMKTMSECGVSSVAISRAEEEINAGSGVLLSAVSVTDIGKTVAPSQSKQILHMPLQQFVSQIREPHGRNDGEEKYPVYSVSAASTLRYTIEKILATNSHRVFITEEPRGPEEYSPIASTPPSYPPIMSNNGRSIGPQLRGVVSVVDILSLFARLAGLPDIDPMRMQKHRRASSASISTGSSPQQSTILPRPIPSR